MEVPVECIVPRDKQVPLTSPPPMHVLFVRSFLCLSESFPRPLPVVSLVCPIATKIQGSRDVRECALVCALVCVRESARVCVRARPCVRARARIYARTRRFRWRLRC